MGSGPAIYLSIMIASELSAPCKVMLYSKFGRINLALQDLSQATKVGYTCYGSCGGKVRKITQEN